MVLTFMGACRAGPKKKKKSISSLIGSRRYSILIVDIPPPVYGKGSLPLSHLPVSLALPALTRLYRLYPIPAAAAIFFQPLPRYALYDDRTIPSSFHCSGHPAYDSYTLPHCIIPFLCLQLLFFLRRCVWWRLSIEDIGWSTVAFNAIRSRVNVGNVSHCPEEILTH